MAIRQAQSADINGDETTWSPGKPGQGGLRISPSRDKGVRLRVPDMINGGTVTKEQYDRWHEGKYGR